VLLIVYSLFLRVYIGDPSSLLCLVVNPFWICDPALTPLVLGPCLATRAGAALVASNRIYDPIIGLITIIHLGPMPGQWTPRSCRLHAMCVDPVSSTDPIRPGGRIDAHLWHPGGCPSPRQVVTTAQSG